MTVLACTKYLTNAQVAVKHDNKARRFVYYETCNYSKLLHTSKK